LKIYIACLFPRPSLRVNLYFDSICELSLPEYQEKIPGVRYQGVNTAAWGAVDMFF